MQNIFLFSPEILKKFFAISNENLMIIRLRVHVPLGCQVESKTFFVHLLFDLLKSLNRYLHCCEVFRAWTYFRFSSLPVTVKPRFLIFFYK